MKVTSRLTHGVKFGEMPREVGLVRDSGMERVALESFLRQSLDEFLGEEDLESLALAIGEPLVVRLAALEPVSSWTHVEE